MLPTADLDDLAAGVQIDPVVAVVRIGLKVALVVAQEGRRMRPLVRQRVLKHGQRIHLISHVVPKPRGRPLARLDILPLHRGVIGVDPRERSTSAIIT